VLGNGGAGPLWDLRLPQGNTTEVPRGAHLKVVATVTFNEAGQVQHLVTIA
jgi:hypothetical protein